MLTVTNVHHLKELSTFEVQFVTFLHIHNFKL